MWPYLEIQPLQMILLRRDRGWATIQYGCILIKGEFGHRDRNIQMEDYLKTQGIHQLQAKACLGHQKLERGLEQSLPHSPQKKATLPTADMDTRLSYWNTHTKSNGCLSWFLRNLAPS